MTFVLIVLIGWGILSPFIIANDLKRRIAFLEAQVLDLRTSQAGAPASAPVRTAVIIPQIITPEPITAEPATAEPITQAEQPPPLPPLFHPPQSPQNWPAWEAIEQWIIQRWIIAAGGLTAALGGLFIVRYSIEQGLLGPVARVVLGALVGLALVGAAEWIRRRSAAGDERAKPVSPQIPAALAAAGLVTLYGVVYAAHSFYGLIPAALAFILLALIAFASLGAGLVYGALAAALGAGMGLVAPGLVASDNPNAAILFPYLFFVTAGIFAVIRYRNWPWLVWLALGGNGLWQLSWMMTVGGGQATVRVLHLLAIPVLSAWLLLLRDPWPEPAGPWWRWDWSKAPLPVWTVGATVLGSFGLLWMLAAGTGFDGAAATGWGVGIALLMLLAWWAPTQQPLIAIVAMLTVGLAAAWAVPDMTPDETVPWLVRGPLLAPTLVAYVSPVSAYAALFGLGGFILLWRSSQPGLWASVSAAVPPALLALLYARLSGLAQSLPWASVGLGLAVLALIAADRAGRHRPRLNAAMAAYAAAVTVGVALAATMALHTAWLNVALSLELPALAWIHQRTRTADTEVPGLPILAGIIAAILTVRLIFNPYVAAYAGAMPVLLNWMAYGYGVPAMACWLASRWFGPRDSWVVSMLQAAALAFATALLSLELWHIASGGGELFAEGEPLRQTAALGNGWLILGLFLLRLERNGSNPVRAWGWRLIGGGGLGWTILVTLLIANPYWNGFDVGETPVFNLLLLAYGLPALLLGLGANELGRQHRKRASRIVTAASVLLSIVTVLLEIRQAFHGSRIDDSSVFEAETYSYSAGILLIALAALALGLRWPKSDLRQAGFGLLALTLGKAFLIDMADLTGLWRAASFLGLGLCLIGVGYAYQKLQHNSTAAKTA